MNYDVSYQDAIMDSLRALYTKVASFLPNLLVAVIVLLLGWIVGSFLSTVVRKVLEAIRIDTFANQLGLNQLSERMDRKLSLSAFGAWLVKWFFFLGSIMAAANIFGLSEVTTFFNDQVLTYAGNVIIAMVILLLGILASEFFSGIVSSSVRASGLHASSALGSITRWAILIFSIIAALSQLQIATAFLQDLFRAVVAMLAIAGGIAFGMGGRDHAKKILDEVESNLTKRE